MGCVRAAHFVALHAIVSQILFLVRPQKLVSIEVNQMVW
jgi:hypothetical protein